MSAAKIAERSARACVLAADLEGAAKEARRTAPRAPEERLEANALTADLADEPRRTDAREDATAPGDEGRGREGEGGRGGSASRRGGRISDPTLERNDASRRAPAPRVRADATRERVAAARSRATGSASRAIADRSPPEAAREGGERGRARAPPASSAIALASSSDRGISCARGTPHGGGSARRARGPSPRARDRERTDGGRGHHESAHGARGRVGGSARARAGVCGEEASGARGAARLLVGSGYRARFSGPSKSRAGPFPPPVAACDSPDAPSECGVAPGNKEPSFWSVLFHSVDRGPAFETR